MVDLGQSCVNGVPPVQAAFATMRSELWIPEDILRHTHVRTLGKDNKFLVETPNNMAKLVIDTARTVKSQKIYINEFLTKNARNSITTSASIKSQIRI